MIMIQSERTKKVASACKEVNEGYSNLLENGVHSCSKIGAQKKQSLIRRASEKHGVTERNIKIIVNP